MLFHGAKNRIFSYFFQVTLRQAQRKKVSKKTFVAVKASAFISECSLRVIMFRGKFDYDERQTKRSRSPLYITSLYW